MRLWDRYVLWRHSRGFGVHSPMAFRLVTEVLKPYGTYYAYPAINRRFGSDARLARMVYRLLAWLEPSEITVLGNDHWQWLATGFGHRHGGTLVLVSRDPRNPTEQHALDTARHIVALDMHTPEGRLRFGQLRGITMAVDTHRRLAYATRIESFPRQTVHFRTLLNTQ